MILHIVVDDKFIDAAYRVFEEAYPNKNEFVLISNPYPLKYIRTTPIKFVPLREVLFGEFIKSLKNYEMVIIHWLDDIKLRIINKADYTVKFVWLGWGGDYYDLITNGDFTKLFKPKTLTLYKSIDSKKNNNFKNIKSLIKKSILNIFLPSPKKVYVVNRINFFAPVIYEDYELLLSNFPGFRPKYIEWNYYTLEDDIIKGIENQEVIGENILLGNSASYENNHLDALELLKNIDLKGRKIICPLSYGDMDYAKRIIEYGKQVFGEKFVPIDSFLPLDIYNSIIRECSVVLINSLRQQAVGNIVTALYLGAAVYLDPRNPVYKFFKKRNAYIYTIDEVINGFNKLDELKLNTNREIIKGIWSKELIIEKTKKLIEIVKNEQL